MADETKFKLITVTPRKGTTPAKVHGIDWNEMTDELFYEIKTAWRIHGVLVSEGGTGSDKAMVDFSRRMGASCQQPLQKKGHPLAHEEYEDICLIKESFNSNTGNNKLAPHYDEHWLPDCEVPTHFILWPRIAPNDGPATCFFDPYAFFEDLSETERNILQNLKVIAQSAYAFEGPLFHGTPKPISQMPFSERSILLKDEDGHPFVCPGPFMPSTFIPCMPQDKGREIIEGLQKRLFSAKYMIKHHLAAGEVLLARNNFMHSREDYDGVKQPRTMLRILTRSPAYGTSFWLPY